ncbi:tRNA (adenosine(37)-N6)-dimethylallyltransferase MiaA, partial [Alphaproteobacteria bacterium]|nr:tRNA (adenosine(37)-N6)-dimethylallyltransferase MiaA [Alphaproteobacteria bacterium]
MKKNSLKKKLVIILGGPTASGKSKLALSLAKKINGEIINGDSMQVYKNLPILTSQPNLEDQKEVEHHLYGYVATTKSYNAMNWMLEAKQVINKLHKQNKNVILVGGSGLYLEFLYKGVNKYPVISKEIKNKVKKIFNDNSLNELYSFALKIDYEYTSKVSKKDIFRLTKLVEVYYQSNKNITYFQNNKR